MGGEKPKNDSEATVTFNPPIQPGQTVTVALDATANPWYGGVYLFGVTAYPEGNSDLWDISRLRTYSSTNLLRGCQISRDLSFFPTSDRDESDWRSG